MNIVQKYRLPCGGIAEFDGDYSYRCWSCMAVVGSIGQPRECKEKALEYDLMKKLGGRGFRIEDHIYEHE